MVSDARLMVRFGVLAEWQSSELLLLEDRAADLAVDRALDRAVLRLPATHRIGCDCCVGRDIWAEALAACFVAMVKGDRPNFSSVLAVLDDAGAARLRRLLVEDRLLAARFRVK
jgi:hypothetical protein